MTRTRDDFGFAKPISARSRKGTGFFTPRHLIGRSLVDVATPEKQAEPRFNGIRDLMRLAAGRRQNSTILAFSDPLNPEEEDNDTNATTTAISRRSPAASSEATPKQSSRNKYSMNVQMKSQVDDLVLGHDIDCSGADQYVDLQEEAYENRRMKRPVIGTDGAPISVQTPSATNQKPPGLRQVDKTPTPQKAFSGGSKRTFPWSYRPTAWDNPITYEEPPEPGKRASHPVCANGIVATDRRRSFPEQMHQRNPLLQGDNLDEEAQIHISDAALRLQQMKYPDTSRLTRWHYDPKYDIDPPKPHKFSMGVPNRAYTLTREETVWANPAGKPGSSDHYRPERIEEEKPMMPLTAR
jgi:hypothetical protein